MNWRRGWVDIVVIKLSRAFIRLQEKAKSWEFQAQLCSWKTMVNARRKEGYVCILTIVWYLRMPKLPAELDFRNKKEGLYFHSICTSSAAYRYSSHDVCGFQNLLERWSINGTWQKNSPNPMSLLLGRHDFASSLGGSGFGIGCHLVSRGRVGGNSWGLLVGIGLDRGKMSPVSTA